MLAQLIPLLCLLQGGEVEPPTDPVASLIGRPSIGVWFAPMATAKIVLPIGVQVGVQFGRLMVAASYGSLPIEYSGASQWSLGGRWYLSQGGATLYVAFEGGWRNQKLDDTGGRTQSYDFYLGGMGAELSKWGLSLSNDLQIGYEDSQGFRGPSSALGVQYRLGVGFHF